MFLILEKSEARVLRKVVLKKKKRVVRVRVKEKRELEGRTFDGLISMKTLDNRVSEKDRARKHSLWLKS